MEPTRAILWLTLPVVVITVLILTNWRDAGITFQLVLAYGAGIAVGVVLQQYRASASRGTRPRGKS